MFFKDVVSRLVGSFDDRCQRIYGPAKPVIEQTYGKSSERWFSHFSKHKKDLYDQTVHSHFLFFLFVRLVWITSPHIGTWLDLMSPGYFFFLLLFFLMRIVLEFGWREKFLKLFCHRNKICFICQNNKLLMHSVSQWIMALFMIDSTGMWKLGLRIFFFFFFLDSKPVGNKGVIVVVLSTNKVNPTNPNVMEKNRNSDLPK